MVEIYDLTNNATSKLANITTRGFVDPNNLLVGGIMVGGGSGQRNGDIVVRALGPELKTAGVTNALDDPTLEVRNRDGTVVGFNDDFAKDNPTLQTLHDSGLAPPSNPQANLKEAAMYLSLPPAHYTALVRSKGTSTGVAVVEFYDLRD